MSEVVFCLVDKNNDNECLSIAKLLQAQGEHHDQFYLRPEARRHPSLTEIQEYVIREYRDDDSYIIFKCICDDNIIGFAICQLIDNDRPWHPDFAHKILIIDELFVSEKMRGKGIGKKFLDSIIDYAKQNGCSSIELTCMTENSPTLAFYDNNDFLISTSRHVLRRVL